MAAKAAEDFAWVDDRAFPFDSDFELVIVPKADEIESPGSAEEPPDIVEVVYRNSSSSQFQLGKFAMQVQVGEFPRDRGDSKKVAVVVSKDNVYGIRIAGSEFLDDERRAKIPTADESVRASERDEGFLQLGDVVMNI